MDRSRPHLGGGAARIRPARLVGLGLAGLAVTAGCLGGGTNPSSVPTVRVNTSVPASPAAPAQATNAPANAPTQPASGPVLAPTVPPAPPPPAGPDPAGTPAVIGTVVQRVEIRDIAFRPAELQVRVGETVEWINQETPPHTTVSKGSPEWQSGLLNQGDTFRHTFRQPGTYQYWCTIHPDMLASISVRP